MEHNSAVLGHPISTSFPQVDGWSTDPWVWGVTHCVMIVLHNVCYILCGLYA